MKKMEGYNILDIWHKMNLMAEAGYIQTPGFFQDSKLLDSIPRLLWTGYNAIEMMNP